MHKVISLFTGAGGLDLGFEAAGFETAVAVEMDPDAVTTLRFNRDWPVLDRDIHAVSSQELARAGGLGQGQASILIGGPPCQPFSKSGYWAHGDAKRLSDPRATTLEAYLRVLRDLKPTAFLLENVAGLAYQSKDEGVQLLETTINAINAEIGTNYSFELALLNAADYGIPQERERAFIVGHREGRRFQFPEPTHRRLPRGGGHLPMVDEIEAPQAQLGLFCPQRPVATCAWDAIGDLEDDDDPRLRMKGKWADLLPSIPEGCNYLYHTERGEGLPLFGWRRRYWSFLLKLARSRPSWTLQAQPGPAVGPFHWKSRRLSAREMCRLQTFPEGFEVQGNLRSAQRQLGNAVPSALAEVLARAIRRQFFEDTRLDPRPRLIPTVRPDRPRPEPVAPVAARFLSLSGDHEAHPGTGQGYRAAQRTAGSAGV